MNIPHADFLTPAEFFRGLDLLRPGALPGKHVDPSAVALIYTLHPCEGDEADIGVSPEDRRLIFWPAIHTLDHRLKPASRQSCTHHCSVLPIVTRPVSGTPSSTSSRSSIDSHPSHRFHSIKQGTAHTRPYRPKRFVCAASQRSFTESYPS